MNELIKELEKQATTVVEGWSDERGTTRHYEFNREKFAELIIAECVKVCEQQAENAAVQKKSTFLTDEGRQLYSGVWGGAKGCSGAIMNHFGVANE